MEALQARDWREWMDEKQEVEQAIQRSYHSMLLNIRNVCSELCYSLQFGQEPLKPEHDNLFN